MQKSWTSLTHWLLNDRVVVWNARHWNKERPGRIVFLHFCHNLFHNQVEWAPGLWRSFVETVYENWLRKKCDMYYAHTTLTSLQKWDSNQPPLRKHKCEKRTINKNAKIRTDPRNRRWIYRSLFKKFGRDSGMYNVRVCVLLNLVKNGLIVFFSEWSISSRKENIVPFFERIWSFAHPSTWPWVPLYTKLPCQSVFHWIFFNRLSPAWASRPHNL